MIVADSNIVMYRVSTQNLIFSNLYATEKKLPITFCHN